MNSFSSLGKWGINPWEEMEAHACGGRSYAHPAVLGGFPLARNWSCSPSVPSPVPAVGARHSFDLDSGKRSPGSSDTVYGAGEAWAPRSFLSSDLPAFPSAACLLPEISPACRN